MFTIEKLIILLKMTTGACLGAIAGSSIMCYLVRRARGESWVTGRSHCDYCEKPLEWYELIPIISYLLTGGRCKKCKAKIPSEFLASEILFCLIGTALSTCTFTDAEIPSLGVKLLVMVSCALSIFLACKELAKDAKRLAHTKTKGETSCGREEMENNIPTSEL